MVKETLQVVAEIDQPDRIHDLGDYVVQVSMGNLVVNDRRGLPLGYGTYSYTPYQSLSSVWQVVFDNRGQPTALRARIDGSRVLIARTSSGPELASDAALPREEPNSSSAAAGAVAAAAIGLAAGALTNWLRKRRSESTTLPAVEPSPTASADDLYRQGRELQGRGEHAPAAEAFRGAVAARQGDKSSVSGALSIFQLALYSLQSADKDDARLLFAEAAERFDALAEKAQSEGHTDVATMARTEAGRARSMAMTAATGKPWLAPDFVGSDVRQKQLTDMRRDDEERGRRNQAWAQGLGRI